MNRQNRQSTTHYIDFTGNVVIMTGLPWSHCSMYDNNTYNQPHHVPCPQLTFVVLNTQKTELWETFGNQKFLSNVHDQYYQVSSNNDQMIFSVIICVIICDSVIIICDQV